MFCVERSRRIGRTFLGALPGAPDRLIVAVAVTGVVGGLIGAAYVAALDPAPARALADPLVAGCPLAAAHRRGWCHRGAPAPARRRRRHRAARRQHPRERRCRPARSAPVPRPRVPARHRGGWRHRPRGTPHADHRHHRVVHRDPVRAHRRAAPHLLHHGHGGGLHGAVRRAARRRGVRLGDPAPQGPRVLRGARPRSDRLGGGLRRVHGRHRLGAPADLALPCATPAPDHGRPRLGRGVRRGRRAGGGDLHRHHAARPCGLPPPPPVGAARGGRRAARRGRLHLAVRPDLRRVPARWLRTAPPRRRGDAAAGGARSPAQRHHHHGGRVEGRVHHPAVLHGLLPRPRRVGAGCPAPTSWCWPPP